MEIFVARQPIFDKSMNVFAYELLYRVDPGSAANVKDGDQATSAVITNTFLLIGFDNLTGGKPAFINFTRNMLAEEVATNLPRELVAVEVLEDVDPDDKVIEACRKLKDLGYTLVLDDFVFKGDLQPLIDLADIIKVDFLYTRGADRGEIIRQVGNKNIKFLAEKVETKEEFEEALGMGYSYFQGYFFSKPDTLSARDIPGYKLNYLHLLQELNRPETDFCMVEEIIKRDVSITYKLLKYINSASFGFRSKINSVKHALVLLGLQEIKKWISLIALRSMGEDKPDELMTSSILRARFSELIALSMGNKKRSPDYFLMGLLSMIDAFVDRPMPVILEGLPISEDIKMALISGEGLLGEVFCLVLAYEKGQWDSFASSAELLGLNEKTTTRLFLDSIEWSNQVVNT